MLDELQKEFAFIMLQSDQWRLLFMKMYILWIIKEITVNELWKNYTVSVKDAIKTTFLLALMPLTSACVIIHYILVKIKEKAIKR